MNQKNFFTAVEVAGHKGVHLRTLETQIKAGKVPPPAVRYPRLRLWSREQVQSLRKK
jgi:hypothetical protein